MLIRSEHVDRICPATTCAHHRTTIGEIVHIVWGTATIAIIIVVVGFAFIIARRPIARFAAFRQQKYYPTGVKQVFGAQAKPTYYLVLGIVVTLVGLFIGLASLRR
jgi:hypothetical protein